MGWGLLLGLVEGFDNCQLGSRLMLTWAKHMTHIQFYDESMCFPGSQDFMTAVRDLRLVAKHCDTALAAAQANYLLSRSSSIYEVVLSGKGQMSRFPISVRKLKVASSGLHDKHVTREYYPLDAFIPNVASCRLPDLQNVSWSL